MHTPVSFNPSRCTVIAAGAAALFSAPLAQAASPGEPLGPAIDISAPYSSQQRPAIARNASGAMVVAWDARDGNGSLILAQRLDAAGNPQGASFQVSPSGYFEQQATVAINDNGEFVIGWYDATFRGAYVRRYTADGTPQGDDMQVPGSATPAIAMDDDGDFVVAWTAGKSFGGNDYTCSYVLISCFNVGTSVIRARRYNASGAQKGFGQIIDLTTQASVFFGNGFSTGMFDVNPSLAMSHDGSFLVTWDRVGKGPLTGVYMRRFDALNLPGLTQRVASNNGQAASPRAATDGRHGYVVAYKQPDGIYAQAYGPLGLGIGKQQLVEDSPSPGDGPPSVSMDAASDFVVAWPFKAQRFASGGGKLGLNFAIDTTPGASPVVASDAAGNFAIAWGENNQSIKVRLFAGP